MFYDRAKIYVKGGDGGNGIVAFRREKYIPEGGPAGGDGGRGGSITFVADEGLRTLIDFRYRQHYKGDRGQHGMGKNMHGKNGDEMRVRVPVGTVIRDEASGQILADLVEDGQEVQVAKGGRGGRGNSRFVSAKNRVPMLAENGEPGEEKWILLELKLLADVGLVGFPNVGKSTIISQVSAAKPKIADYPFTTITPHLGVVRVDQENSFVLADVPGLIEGAHEGAGLGHYFLRHLERTKVLIHVLDMSELPDRTPWDDFEVINSELRQYREQMAKQPQIVAANKMDQPGAEERLAELKKRLGDRYEIFPVSAATNSGLAPLMQRAYQLVLEYKAQPEEAAAPEIKKTKVEAREKFIIETPEPHFFVVSGAEIERLVAMTNFDNEAAVIRLQKIFKAMGLDQALRDRGAENGDAIQIKDLEFDFAD